jgi:hypothetical protein
MPNDSILRKLIQFNTAESDSTNRYEPHRTDEKEPPRAGGRPRSSEGEQIFSILQSGDKWPCFGGYLFRRVAENNTPVLSFAVQDMTEDEIQAANGHYLRFNALDPHGFLCYWKYRSFDRYTVFDFFSSDRQTLRECQESSHRPWKPEEMMQKLTTRLVQYHNRLTAQHLSYYPLSCLSMDTVLMDSEEDIYILPLVPHKGRYPMEIPREASLNNGGSSRSDLFSAAYVSVLFCSEMESPDAPMAVPESPVVLQCLQVFPSWRPSLEEVYNLLSGRTQPKDSTPAQSEEGNLFGSRRSRSASSRPGGFGRGGSEVFSKKVKESARKFWEFLSLEEEETTAETDDTFQSAPEGYSHRSIPIHHYDDDYSGEA